LLIEPHNFDVESRLASIKIDRTGTKGQGAVAIN
jgi:hypothetical protein